MTNYSEELSLTPGRKYLVGDVTDDAEPHEYFPRGPNEEEVKNDFATNYFFKLLCSLPSTAAFEVCEQQQPV